MKKYNKEEITTSLSNTIEAITPNIFSNIKASIRKEEKMKRKFKWTLIPALTFAALMIVFGGIYYDYNYVTDSLVGIDVNPSIEIEISKSNRVINVNALNEGATKIIDGMDLKNVDLDIVINALIGSMVKYGYLTGDDANILVSVQNSNETKLVEVKNEVTSIIDKSLDGSNVNATVINQTITTNDKEIKELATANNISYGKSQFISALIKKDSTLSYETLAAMSLREIASLIESRNIDISDIVEKDDDDSTVELIDDAIEDLNEEQEIISNNNNYISKEDAKNIAYRHAGVNASDIKNVGIKLDRDDNLVVYEIEFRTNTKKYEYELTATDGTIVNFETESISTATTPSTTTYITETEAKNIAYKHAGINASDARMLKIVLDSDDGIKVYEIEFVVGAYEYDYEIDATTGKIIDFEKDLDD